ncbi:MAG TPA: hypothetical protein VGB26_03950 [Nitrospiria bacterium]|jgi:hypothetical protein
MTEEFENGRLRKLVKELVDTINNVFSDSSQIKKALKEIEEEGYRIDIVLASITRIHRKDDEGTPPELVYEFNPFDKAFLQSLKIRLDSGENNPSSE